MELEYPKLSATCTIQRAGKDKNVLTYNGDIPEKLMTTYMKLVGDGKAKVSVSADFAMKTFGDGISSMATVSLSCNQDEGSIRAAAQFAGELAREFAHMNAIEASNELKEMKNQVGGK
jgi:hypothetical protein